MAQLRSPSGSGASWLKDIDRQPKAKERAPSIDSIPDLKPFNIDTAPPPKSSRSSSFPASSLHSQPFFGRQISNPPLLSPQLQSYTPQLAMTDEAGPDQRPWSVHLAIAAHFDMVNERHRYDLHDPSWVPRTSRIPDGTFASYPPPPASEGTPIDPANPAVQHAVPSETDEEQEFRSIRELYSPPQTPLPGLPQAPQQAAFCVVAFKTWRAEVYVRDPQAQFAADVKVGSNVIVEADRGQDIGQVMFITGSLYKADRYSRNLNLKHHRELVRSSFRFNSRWREIALPPCNPAGAGDPNRKVKIIRRHANVHEIVAMRDKEEMETRSKRLCAELVARHRLDMEVLEAEWQSDYQRLTFFYYSPNYVVFNALVHDLFRIFKKRIWMSSVNASTAGRGGGLASFDPAQGLVQNASGY